jgi:hypothetical protein
MEKLKPTDNIYGGLFSFSIPSEPKSLATRACLLHPLLMQVIIPKGLFPMTMVTDKRR